MSNVLVSDGRVLVRVTVDDNEVVSLSILVLCVLLFFFVHFFFSDTHFIGTQFFKVVFQIVSQIVFQGKQTAPAFTSIHWSCR